MSLYSLQSKFEGHKVLILNLNPSTRITNDIIGGNPLCSHSSVKKNMCTKCGAFVGHIGSESNPLSTYYHVNLLVKKLNPELAIIISDRLIPVDFKSTSQIMNSVHNHKRSVVFCNNAILNIFSLKDRISDDYVFYKGNYINYILSIRKMSDVLWANPNSSETSLNCSFIKA